MDDEIPHEKRWTLIILIGCLSMFMAEVFAGSSQMWFIDIWSLLVTFWLYLGHLLLFLNLAMRSKRTSIPQLYLWGMIFALYESWVTKVLWAGYPGSEGPAIALVGGIAILEFSTLVFFWHPILAFIMPILVYESFALSNESPLTLEKRIFISHLPYLKKGKKKIIIFYIFLILTGASILSFNTGYNVVIAAIAIIGSIGLIYLFYKLSNKKNPNSFSIYTLRLGKKGLWILFIYIALLYLITFIVLLPERIPNTPLPFLIIIGFYIFIGVILRFSKPMDERRFEGVSETEIYNSKFIFKLYGIFLILTILFCLIPPIAIIFAIIIFIGIFILAPFFFILFLIKALKQ